MGWFNRTDIILLKEEKSVQLGETHSSFTIRKGMQCSQALYQCSLCMFIETLGSKTVSKDPFSNIFHNHGKWGVCHEPQASPRWNFRIQDV